MVRASSVLVIIVLILLALGIVMLASASSVRGGQRYKDPQHFMKRQLQWLAVAVVAGAASAFFVDYHWWRRRVVVVPLVALSVVLLALIFMPGLGCKVGGSWRWLKAGPIRVGQPSELAKFASVVLMAAWMSHVGLRAGRALEGWILPVAFLTVMMGLILAEPDYGTTILVGAVGLAIMFAGGSRISHLAITSVSGICMFVFAVMLNENRVRRFIAFLRPEADPDTAHQLTQSMHAFMLGGATGVGLGDSLQKFSYLPEAHTDFILAIIGEELGVVASLVVVLLFVGLLVCGIIISLNAPDMFGRLLGFGITTMISVQAAINIAVVTGCMPTKGLPLPFISAGGSNLVMCVFSVGVLINIARHYEGEITDKHSQTIKDNFHWG